MCRKSKLRVYKEVKECFECKKYFYGVSDMGSKLLFKFRSVWDMKFMQGESLSELVLHSSIN